MRCYGKILGLDNSGRPAAWLVELDNDGTPLLDFTLIPCETLPDIVPIWTITYPVGAEDGTAFTTDETSKLALQVMRRTNAQVRRCWRAAAQQWGCALEPTSARRAVSVPQNAVIR